MADRNLSTQSARKKSSPPSEAKSGREVVDDSFEQRLDVTHASWEQKHQYQTVSNDENEPDSNSREYQPADDEMIYQNDYTYHYSTSSSAEQQHGSYQSPSHISQKGDLLSGNVVSPLGSGSAYPGRTVAESMSRFETEEGPWSSIAPTDTQSHKRRLSEAVPDAEQSRYRSSYPDKLETEVITIQKGEGSRDGHHGQHTTPEAEGDRRRKKRRKITKSRSKSSSGSSTKDKHEDHPRGGNGHQSRK